MRVVSAALGLSSCMSQVHTRSAYTVASKQFRLAGRTYSLDTGRVGVASQADQRRQWPDKPLQGSLPKKKASLGTNSRHVWVEFKKLHRRWDAALRLRVSFCVCDAEMLLAELRQVLFRSPHVALRYRPRTEQQPANTTQLCEHVMQLARIAAFEHSSFS